MASTVTRVGLQAGSITVLLLGAALLLPVLERIHSAAWQWFKFGQDGHVFLSRNTSYVFYLLLFVALALTLFFNMLGRRHSLQGVVVATRLASAFTILAGVLYFALGASQFNVWRA